MHPRGIRVGLFYNLRKDFKWSKGSASDMDADWDTLQTIEEIRRGLECNKFDVIELGDPRLLCSDEERQRLDIVFSICEMQGYRFREALVPSLCELVAIPYVFSPPDTMMISLDKNLCNWVVKQSGCRVPNWYLVRSSQDVIDASLFTSYPYIVKPSAEGSGIGINEHSVVHTFDELCTQVSGILENYSEPAMIQKFMPGREFTVGVLETHSNVVVLAPLEISPKQSCANFTYNILMKEQADSFVHFHPLQGESTLETQIANLARRAFKSIGCHDAARVDIRLSDDEIPHFLEINPLPHLHPSFGDFCKSAKTYGLGYNELIGIIVNNALSRYGLVSS